jgi:ABC-type lipoprotein export system ATPase subunit
VPHFNIIKKNTIKDKSFRVAQLYDQFDLNDDHYEERFEGNIDLEKEWQIGVIVGKSGTGKSTIAKELFSDYFFTPKYKSPCVIDDFPKMDSTELFNILSSVGFSSPPSWLKPYSVLSNGEKMRADLARAICEKRDIIVFDEYTSVVDREVAQLGSFALQRAIRKTQKKFIAVTCHYDIINWLEPDFVFSTDSMEYRYTRGCLRRPQIKLEIYETRGFWEMFRRYHYLNHGCHRASKQFVAFINDNPVALDSFLQTPSEKGLLMRGHRLVVLPDYQGLGIAKRMQNLCCEHLSKTYKRIGFTTSQKSFAKSCIKDKLWKLIHAGRHSPQHYSKAAHKADSSNRNTFSFRWIGNKEV